MNADIAVLFQYAQIHQIHNFIQSNKSSTQLDARHGFNAESEKMWKWYDFRCLKPIEGQKSETWPHYEMNGFRAAKNEEELSQVKEIKFDKNFFNMEDPRVWKRMTDKRKAPRLWKKTYGFDFAAVVQGKDAKANLTKCYMDCFKVNCQKHPIKLFTFHINNNLFISRLSRVYLQKIVR